MVGMQYRRFGRTEISMPVFSCGGMRYQHGWEDLPLDEIPAESQANVAATISRAMELGINHIETVRGYGSSERQLGAILSQWDRPSLIVQTKIAPLADANEFRREFLDSLARLRLEHVDLLALHGINTFEHLWWATRRGGCLEMARQLVAEGKARHVGFSTHGETDLIEAALVGGQFDYINLHWYYIFQRNWHAIEMAKSLDMGVFIISPSDKGGMLYRPSTRLVELCQPLHPLVFNCLFCLARAEIHTLSLGAAQPSDFDLQCSSLELLPRAARLLPPITDRLDRAWRKVVGSEGESLLASLPLWHNTPGYVNIPVILWLRWLLLAFDMREYAQMRYNLLGRGGHWFGGLGGDHVRELDWEKLLADSPFAEQIPAWIAETHRLLAAEPQKRLSQA